MTSLITLKRANKASRTITRINMQWTTEYVARFLSVFVAMDGSSGPETKVHRGTAQLCVSTALYGLSVCRLQYTPIAPQFLSGKRTVFVLRRCTRPLPSVNPGVVMVAAKRAACTDGVRTPYGQSGTLRGLRLVPSKWSCLVPPTSPHHPCQGATQYPEGA
jgi:hypothetical protein